MSMTVDEVLGQRVQERREALRMSQAKLGELLGDYLEKPWPRQTVSTAEKGKRPFRAEELVALEQILHLNGWWLIPGEEITFASGRVATVAVIEFGAITVDLLTELGESLVSAMQALSSTFDRISDAQALIWRESLPKNEEEARAVLEELAAEGDEEARQALERARSPSTLSWPTQ